MQSKEYRQAYYLKHKAKKTQQAKAWKEANPDAVVRIQRRHRERSRETIKKQHRRHRMSAIGRAGELYRQAKRRANKQEVPIDITKEDIVEHLERNTCEVTGIPFQSYPGPQGPFSPSLDRIVPELGYVKGNVQVVVWALNAARGDWGDDVLWKVVAARWPERINGASRGA